MFSIPPTAKFGKWAMAAMVLGIVKTWQLQRCSWGEMPSSQPQFTDLRPSSFTSVIWEHDSRKWWHDTHNQKNQIGFMGLRPDFIPISQQKRFFSANWVPHSIPWSSKIPLSPSYVAWGYLSPLYFLGTQQPSSHEASNIKALGPRILGQFLDAIPWTLRVKNTPVALNFCCDVAMG